MLARSTKAADGIEQTRAVMGSERPVAAHATPRTIANETAIGWHALIHKDFAIVRFAPLATATHLRFRRNGRGSELDVALPTKE